MATSDRLLSILDLFDLEHPDWSVDQAAESLNLAKSTAYRYFASLTAAGILAPFGTGRYVLGPAIVRYDRQLRLTDPLISAARGEMRDLARRRPGQIVVFLCRLLGKQVMCVHQESTGDPSFAVSYERGRPMPLFAGSASKIILANLPGRHVRAMFDRHPEAFLAAGLGGDWSAVRALLRSIRTAGTLIASSEVDAGMRGVSVPLLVEGGALYASLNIAGPEAELDVDEAAMLAIALRECGGRIVSAMRSPES